MKKTLLIALCFFFLLYPLLNGYSEQKERYGFGLKCYEFASMGMFQKLGYVQGWSDGGVVAFDAISNAVSDIEFDAIWNKKPTSIDSKKHLEIAMGALKEKGIDFDYVSAVQIAETTDKICSDPRVKHWWMNEVMPIVRGRLKEGWTDKDVDEVIAYHIKRNELNRRVKNLTPNKILSSTIGKEYSSLILNKPKVLKDLEAYRPNALEKSFPK